MVTISETNNTEADYRERIFRNRHVILVIILACAFLAVVDVQIVAIALPTITHLLNAPIGQTQWIATSYVVTVLSTVLVFGTISTQFGKGRLLKAGLFLFTISSLACGLSTSLTELILFRVIQGLGASMMMGILMALIIEVFPPGERGRAMGFNTAVIALGLIVGPSAGGFIVDAIGWPYIFLFNVPLGILLLIGAMRYINFDYPIRTWKFSDYPGAILLIILMATLTMALNTLANPPIRITNSVIWAFVTLFALILFIFQERSVTQPLLNITIFTNRRFVLPSISLILYLAATFILLTSQPFYFEGVMGLSASHIGIIALITPITMILCAPLFGWLYDRAPWKGYPVTGLVLMGLAYFGCGITFTQMNFPFIILVFIVTGIARSIFQGPNVIEIMAALPPQLQGMGSGLITTLMYLGIVLGISITTIFLTAGLTASAYTGQVLDAGAPLLAGIFGQIMYIGGGICLVGAMCSYRR